MALDYQINREAHGSPLSVSSVDDDYSNNSLPSTLANEGLQLAFDKTTTEDDIVKAIQRCKELVLESDNCSLERKWLVRHLIELRLRLQEHKEASADPLHPRNRSGISKRMIYGHHMLLQPLLKNSNFRRCDNCTGLIWSVVQTWYECQDCGYCAHYKCLSNIMRECAHVTATEKGGYELDICPSVGLSAQKYLCEECQTLIPVDTNWTEARRCDYSGKYYCSACHWGNVYVIPARIIHNWDFSKRPVCQASFQLLQLTEKNPLINMEKLNPKLFELVHELHLVRQLRYELNSMRKYLMACRSAQDNHFLWKAMKCPYLIDFPDLYSLQDLVDTENGDLPTRLQSIAELFLNHIKEECEICKGHGHICEICSNAHELFPFEEIAMMCEKCNAVLHKKCLERKNSQCPKCIRISERAKLAEQTLDLEDND